MYTLIKASPEELGREADPWGLLVSGKRVRLCLKKPK